VDFRAELERRLDLPVGIENDANAAAYAEFKLGAGRDVSDLVLLTLGTGVGGGIVIAGSLFHGWAELGHVVIVEDGEPCRGACSGRGHVEAYCSGRAAGALARRVLGGDATARDLVAQRHRALDQVGHHLGVAIGSLVNIFHPQMVVIGGGFGVAAFDLLLPSARMAVLTEALAPAGQELAIESAILGSRAGLIGAGLVAFEVE
jgi:glucokinase